MKKKLRKIKKSAKWSTEYQVYVMALANKFKKEMEDTRMISSNQTIFQWVMKSLDKIQQICGKLENGERRTNKGGENSQLVTDLEEVLIKA